jgi:hypothetical protein
MRVAPNLGGRHRERYHAPVGRLEADSVPETPYWMFLRSGR